MHVHVTIGGVHGGHTQRGGAGESMETIYNGMPASGLAWAQWQASRRGDPEAACAELAGLPDESIAMRNAHDPEGCALIYTRAEIAAFIVGAKEGEFDDLMA